MGIQSGQRFVEINHLGRMQQTAGDGQLLLHAARKFAGQGILFVGEFQFFQQGRAGFFVVGHLINAGDEIQVLPDGEIIEQARFVGEKRELFFGGNRVTNDVMAADANRSARGRNDAGKTAQRGGLARAVRADQADDFAGLDGKRQIVHGGEFAVKLGEAFNLNHALERVDRGFVGGSVSASRRRRKARKEFAWKKIHPA